MLEPGRAVKTDKLAILDDVVRVLNQLRIENEEFKEENKKLQDEIKTLKCCLVGLKGSLLFPCFASLGTQLLMWVTTTTSTLIKSNFPPYGRDFVSHKPTGRFCNGKLATDFTGEMALLVEGLDVGHETTIEECIISPEIELTKDQDPSSVKDQIKLYGTEEGLSWVARPLTGQSTAGIGSQQGSMQHRNEVANRK